MRGVVIHAAKDLRIEDVAHQPLGPAEVRIRITIGGICGSDLHYFNHGGPGAIRLKQPMVLGHEISGVVIDAGSAIVGLALGQRVAVNPSRPCGRCRRCREGLRMHCEDMRFLGSAMRFPHVQGGFRQDLVVSAEQAVPIPDHMSAAVAAMAEPLAVCLHAVERAGPVTGKRVLVTGCGPIGLLIIAACRHAGALEIVATDVMPFAISLAGKMGADRAWDLAVEPGALDDCFPFDIAFEASGAPQAMLKALSLLRPRGILLQVGLASEAQLPVTQIVAREIELRGTFRFDTEFLLAIHLLAQRRIDVRPVITAVLPFEDAGQAFLLASDRTRSSKVQLSFADDT